MLVCMYVCVKLLKYKMTRQIYQYIIILILFCMFLLSIHAHAFPVINTMGYLSISQPLNDFPLEYTPYFHVYKLPYLQVFFYSSTFKLRTQFIPIFTQGYVSQRRVQYSTKYNGLPLYANAIEVLPECPKQRGAGWREETITSETVPYYPK